jgi:hypothetical protein
LRDGTRGTMIRISRSGNGRSDGSKYVADPQRPVQTPQRAPSNQNLNPKRETNRRAENEAATTCPNLRKNLVNFITAARELVTASGSGPGCDRRRGDERRETSTKMSELTARRLTETEYLNDGLSQAHRSAFNNMLSCGVRPLRCLCSTHLDSIASGSPLAGLGHAAERGLGGRLACRPRGSRQRPVEPTATVSSSTLSSKLDDG